MWTTPDNFIPALVMDLFPANVTITNPDTPHTTTQLQKVRVISTAPINQDPNARIFIFKDSDTGPTAHTIAVPLNIEGSPSTGYTITLGDPFPPNTTLQVTPNGGCGCGQRALKNFKPFSTMRHTA